MSGENLTGTVLKILTGVQSGIDVALQDGTYTIGSGDDDDIQIIDVSLKPGHGRLSLRGGKIEMAGAAGELRTRNGLVLAADGDLQGIEPLDIVSAGTSRVALGPRNGNWASIAEAEDDLAPGRLPRTARADGFAGIARMRGWSAIVPVALVLLLAGGGIWYSRADAERQPSPATAAVTELEAVRKAIGAFPFGRALTVEQQVDGVIYVTGFVESPVERRAIMAATREVDAPARVRLQVLETMRSELANLIEEERIAVTFDLAPTGGVVLRGTELDAAKADRFLGLVKERVPGFSAVTSEIETGPTLLSGVRALAVRSQIDPLVMLRLDGRLIEASGVLPTEKIDAWVGFLQAYSTQFADRITLRLLVQLQNPDGTLEPAPGPEAGARVIGAATDTGRDVPLDVARLKAGAFDLADVFVGQSPGAAANAIPSVGAGRSAAGFIDLAGLLGAGQRSETVARPNVVAATIAAEVPQPKAAPALTPADPEQPSSSGDRLLTETVPNEPTKATVETPAPVTAEAKGKAAPQTSVVPSPAVRRVGEGLSYTPAAEPKAPGMASEPKPATADAAPGNGIADMARSLIEMWRSKALPTGAAGERLTQAMDALQKGQVTSGSPAIDFAPIEQRYAPLIAQARFPDDSLEACWKNSHLTQATVGGALFWLDLLSVSRDISIRDLEFDVQPVVLDAALNPARVAECAGRDGRKVRSIYLTEIGRNPSFITFISRDLAAFTLDIAGADIGNGRYIQTQDGRKLKEGSAPDTTSRIAIVGELGVAVQRDNSYAAVVFGDRVSWLVR